MAASVVAESAFHLSALSGRHSSKQERSTSFLSGYQAPSSRNLRRQTSSSPRAQHSTETPPRPPAPSRRELLQILASVAVVGATGPCCQTAVAEEAGSSKFLPYTDKDGKFGLSIPADWAQGEGRASSQRRVVAFYKEGDTDTNVNVVITPLSADYTKMGSFGSAETFGETLVNGLDRSWTKPKGPVAKLLDARTRNGRYFVEYTFQAPGQMKRHLLSSVGMGFDGTYNRLYTVTAQAREDEFAQYEGLLNKVLSSFELKFKSPTY